MPVTKSVEREMHAAARREKRNQTVDTLTKSELKKANKAIEAGDAEAAKAAVTRAISTFDRAADKNILHKNNAARHKSRLMKRLNKTSSASISAEEK